MKQTGGIRRRPLLRARRVRVRCRSSRAPLERRASLERRRERVARGVEVVARGAFVVALAPLRGVALDRGERAFRGLQSARLRLGRTHEHPVRVQERPAALERDAALLDKCVSVQQATTFFVVSKVNRSDASMP